MALVSIQGLTWCQHAGWMLVLYDGASQRRLQITLALPDALASFSARRFHVPAHS